MRVQIVPCLQDNYAYLLVSDAGYAVVVDPSEAEPVAAAIEREGYTLVGIYCTHHHPDHVGGVGELLLAHPKIEVIGSAYDGNHRRIPGLTRALGELDLLWFDSHPVRVMTLPGHTLGAIAFFTQGALFSGDTLFGAGCGRLFEGTAEQMQESLAKLRSLPETTHLYCGHEYTERNLAFARSIEPESEAIAERMRKVQELRARGEPSVPSPLSDELATNPFLRWDEPAVISKARALGAASDDPGAVFAELRRAKDTF